MMKQLAEAGEAKAPEKPKAKQPKQLVEQYDPGTLARSLKALQLYVGDLNDSINPTTARKSMYQIVKLVQDMFRDKTNLSVLSGVQGSSGQSGLDMLESLLVAVQEFSDNMNKVGDAYSELTEFLSSMKER